jgi:Na+-transporting methylmalonyl-CoA/oxaloacetate decarboxylase gamma subunit
MTGSLAAQLLTALELLVGFVIVMFTLALLWGLTALMGRIVQGLERRPARGAAIPIGDAPAGVTAPAPRGAEDAIDDEELVVVCAAAALMLDAPHRVVSVRGDPSSWGRAGRRETQGSHHPHAAAHGHDLTSVSGSPR